MKLFLVFLVALLLWTGSLLYADDFVPPAGSTSAWSPAAVAVEPFVWPVSAQIRGHRVKIVSRFGRRKVPAIPASDTSTVTLPGEEMHEGVDFSVPALSNVRAARSGKVLFAGFSKDYVSRKDKKDKNHLVIVRHSDGKSTRYVHLARLLVRPGQEVKSGEILATSSESDEGTESVLHFEIRENDGHALDPMLFLIESDKAPAR